MTNFKIIFSFLLLTTLISCGRNEPEEKIEKATNLSEVPKVVPKTIEVEKTDIGADSGLAAAFENQISTSNTSKTPSSQNINFDKKNEKTVTKPAEKQAETIINSPLRNLLSNGQLGKSYSKKELIEEYKFPKEAVDLIKQVTYVGTNKLYFKWGSTWLVEKVSDAEFENDTLIFTFKQNKTYVSGGAIGIKYNKKVYTELILNKGTAYIPTVKGYHWDIGK
jgi:hypothetical protein